MKDLKEVTKNLKSLVDFINDGAEGKIENLSEDQAAKVESEATRLFSKASNEEIIKLTEKVATMNILTMNIHFFDNLPNIWSILQNATEITVKVEAD